MGAEFPSKTLWPESIERKIVCTHTHVHTHTHTHTHMLRKLGTELICHTVTMFP